MPERYTVNTVGEPYKDRDGEYIMVKDLRIFLLQKYKEYEPYPYCGDDEYDRLIARQDLLDDLYAEMNLGNYGDIRKEKMNEAI